MKTVVIAGDMAHRYDGRSLVESAHLDQEGSTVKEFKSNLEHFRLNGLPPDIVDPPRPTAEVVFDRIVAEIPLILMVRDAGGESS